MVRIQFTIDSDEYGIEVNPPLGDLDKVYRSQDEIRERVNEAGYEFVDQPPQYRIIAKKHKQSRDSSVIELGDITAKVDPVDEPEPGPGPGPDPRPEPDEVELTLVSPEGERDTRTYGEKQNLGSVSADLKRINDIGLEMRVDIYRSRERERQLNSETPIASVAGETLFWQTSERR